MSHRLREIRTAKGMTQQQVADLSKLSQSYYAQLEGGKRQLNERTMAGVAKALGVTPLDLFAGENEIQRVAMLISALSADDRDAVLRMAERLAQNSPAA